MPRSCSIPSPSGAPRPGTLSTFGLLLTCMIAGCTSHAGVRVTGDAPMRNHCRLASQVLLTGDPAPLLAWATAYIVSCADDGPPALISRWRSLDGAGSALDELTRSTMRIRDGRLYQELMLTAQEGTRPAPIRVAAMLVLAKYVNRGSGVWLTDLVPPDSIRYIPIASGSTTHTSYSDGSVALPNSVGPEVLSMLQRLTQDRVSQPRHVWYAAGRLAKRVEADLRFQAQHPGSY